MELISPPWLKTFSWLCLEKCNAQAYTTRTFWGSMLLVYVLNAQAKCWWCRICRSGHLGAGGGLGKGNWLHGFMANLGCD